MSTDNWPGRSYAIKKDPLDNMPPIRLEHHRTMPLFIEDTTNNPELTAPVRTWEEAESSLLLAAEAVVKARDAQYGTSYEHHAGTSALWSAYLGHIILPEQVSVLLILDKIIRSRTEDKPDHWVDVAGYAAVHSKVQAEMERRNA